MAFNAHSWKEQAEIEGNHLLKRNCCVDWLGFIAAKLNWNRYKARKDLLRHLHSSELALARLWVMDQGGHVEAEIANEINQAIAWAIEEGVSQAAAEAAIAAMLWVYAMGGTDEEAMEACRYYAGDAC